MSAFKQFINISLVPGSTSLKGKSFDPIIMGSGAVAIGIQTITEAIELLAFGYLKTDLEFKMAIDMFSQTPRPEICKVVRKLTATSFVDALTTLSETDPDYFFILITSTLTADLNNVGDFALSTKRVFVGRSTSDAEGNGRDNDREAYYIHDLLITNAVAKIASEPLAFIGLTVPAITSATYDLDVTVGSTLHKLAIALLDSDTWAGIAAKIQIQLRSATGKLETVVILDGKIVITGDPVNAGAEDILLIEPGTTGSGGGDLLTEIDDNITNQVTTIEKAIPGTQIFPDAAVVGRKAGKDPFLTWKWKQLFGIGETNFTLTELNTIFNNRTNTVQKQGGVVYTNEGQVTGTQFKFIDLVVGSDVVKSDMELAIIQLFLDNESIEFSDGGIGQIEAVMRNVLDINGERGIIASLTEDSSDADKLKSDHGDFMYKVSIPQRSDISSNNRANRILDQVSFTYTVGGAIHQVDIDGKFET